MIPPSSHAPDESNAACLATWAEACYSPNEVTENAKLTKWKLQQESGLLYVDDHLCVIAICGSNEPADWRANVDCSRQCLGDWGQAHDIEIPAGFASVRSTAGFLAHSAIVYAGLNFALASRELSLFNLLSRETYLVGHSAGGAVANLLQLTSGLCHAKSVTYGAPKCFDRNSYVPSASRISVRRLSDPVIHVPIFCKHPPAKTMYVGYPGQIRHRIPTSHRPYAYVYAVAGMLRGLISWLFSRCGLGFPYWHGHLMSKYSSDLAFRRLESW